IDEEQTPEQETSYLQSRLRALGEGKTFQLIAEQEGRIVGNAQIEQGQWKGRAHAIISIAISKGFRNQGLGTFMLKELIKQAKEAWDSSIFIEYEAPNEPARKCYERLGFREVARLPGWTDHYGKRTDSVWMVLE
ncbi:MAG: GNAT family N-acetyltransferase, partial [Candidatus Diapherotrites archaeon]|nr:GNAT family N-acetyltransferase [Candidatus Diapherotrites archaeon]